MDIRHIPNCKCNSQSYYYCYDHNDYLCTQHFKTQHLDHTVKFIIDSFTLKTKQSVVQSLLELKRKVENSLQELSSIVEKITARLHEYSSSVYQKILQDLDIINSMIQNFEVSGNLIPAYPLLEAIQSNQQRALDDIINIFDLRISDAFILSEIPKFLNVFSNINEIFTREKPKVEVPKKIVERKNKEYKNIRELQKLYPADHLPLKVESLQSKRNCERIKVFSIDGQAQDNFDSYMFLFRIYTVKELILCNFTEDPILNDLVKKTIKNCKKIKKIQVESCDIGEDTCINLGKCLEKCENLNEICVALCQNGNHITRIIPEQNLSYLITLALSNNLIADEGISKICKLFPAMHRIKYLWLNSNTFSKPGGIDLSIYLKYLVTLEEINLSSNNIGMIAGEIFATLSDLPVLSKIDISSTDLWPEQEIYILKNIWKLKYLDTIVFDMTVSHELLADLKQKIPDYCHIYKENPDQSIRIEVSN
jgi:Leucine Rich repeat